MTIADRENPPEYRSPETSAERAFRYVRRRIWEGTLVQGSRVSQDEVAEAIGSSRIPVREALIALERDGIIRMEPNRGAFVEQLDEGMVRDHYEFYGLILGFAVQRTAERADPEVQKALVAIRDQIGDEADPATISRVSADFHALVRQAGGSPRLRAVSQGLVGLVYGDFFEEVPGSSEVALAALPTIIDDMVSGEGATAFDDYRVMQRRHGLLVVEVMRRRGLIA